MKRILPLFVFLAACLFAGAQATIPTTTPAPTAEDVLKLKDPAYDFGQIAQGKPVYHVFVVNNTGGQPLILDNVQASCGCTTPEWNQKPIPAGGSTEIKVGYNAAGEGHFEKFITITYNTNQTKQLKISGTVWKAPEGSAPANASVQFLKKQTL